jgi:hypothetical protein
MVDITPLVDLVIAIGVGTGAALIIWVGREGLEIARAHLGLKFAAQDADKLAARVKVAAGELETLLDQQVIGLAHVEIKNPLVAEMVNQVIKAAETLVQPEEIAKMIVAAVETKDRGV